MTDATGPVCSFLRRHFRHFNARALLDAAEAYREHLERGGKILVALAGAMSTAELGVSLAEMIRQDKVHALCATGANLEEDVYNLVAHREYLQIPNYRDLTPADEAALRARGMNRVTDTCIPEEAMRLIDRIALRHWQAAEQRGERLFPAECIFRVLRDSETQSRFHIDPSDSWVYAAMEKDLPVFVPGWEDSTLGNTFAAHCIRGEVKDPHTVRSGIETMIWLAEWYTQVSASAPVGLLQVGGGIAGDFVICVVPMLRQDLKRTETPLWSYFCQISDATTSYGSYSGAVPNEKITWEKLDVSTPRFVIESDATIVAPLLFAYVLGW
ncbi:MAG: deoxyhypusine synthase family protein [Bryobacterales bacterium]|nr:deoxyhypusine synthase family protein [Bryobacteraceae bacterium]MDW8130920.1 deoxyhypusine synthase family protein [Bryobacterales bacterium]